MELYLKITASLLLLVQAFHLASLQESTDSPGRTIDKSWLRELAKVSAVSQNAAVTEQNTGFDVTPDANVVEANGEDSSGIASGSMGFGDEDGKKEVEQDEGGNETSNDTTIVSPTSSNELPHMTTTSTEPTSPRQDNMTDAEEEFYNVTMTPESSTTHQSAENSTSFPDFSNHTDLQTTTLAPESNDTTESTAKPEEETGLTEAPMPTSTTTLPTTTKKPEINEPSTRSSSTVVFVPETTETSPATTTAAAPITPEMTNETDKASASGSSSERGLASDSQMSGRKGAWGAVLGTAVAVAFVGLVAYVILKKKHQKGFSHRKLVEEYPSDPVLRLDNSEPLDLNFGGAAYYNPGLQGDNIQMTNFPGRPSN